MTNAPNDLDPRPGETVYQWTQRVNQKTANPKPKTPSVDSDMQAKIAAARAAFEQAYLDGGGDPKDIDKQFQAYLAERDERIENDARQRSKAWLREHF